MTLSTAKLPKNLTSFIFFFLKKQWKWIFIIQVFALAWSFDHTLWPYILMRIIDSITLITGDRSEMWTQLTPSLVMAICLWTGLEVAFRISGFAMAKVIPKLEADIRMAMFEYVTKHSHNYFSNHFAGNIGNKISDMVQNVTYIIQQVTMLFIPVVVALCISFAFFLSINLFFGAILGTWIILQVSIAFSYARKCATLADVHAESRSDLAGKIVDVLGNISAVRLFARQSYESQYLEKFQKSEKIKHAAALWYIEKMKLAMGIVTFLGTGVALNWYMLYSWQQGTITTGEVVFIFNTTWNMNMMLWVATLELPNFYRHIGVCKQALTLVKAEHEIEDLPDAKPLVVTQGEITFENVTFQYRPGQNIFQDKTITIKAGEKVGLVGFSGSGKSTFVHLILRYFDVEKGRILIDGQDISTVTQETLRRSIAFIPQDASLFHRTLWENISYGRLEASGKEILTAVKQASCEEFIERLPDKYEAPVGERGAKLSGGQRQRIAIARAILKNAPILILDEATAALDSITERQIQDSLSALMEGRTTIVIAHRLSTLSGMDRILVFHGGKIIEEGRHEELLASGGHYAQLWQMQAGGFLLDEEEEE